MSALHCVIALFNGDGHSGAFVSFDGEGTGIVEGGVAGAIDGNGDVDASIAGSNDLIFITVILEGDAGTFTDAEGGLVESIDIAAGRAFAFFDGDHRPGTASATVATTTAAAVKAASTKVSMSRQPKISKNMGRRICCVNDLTIVDISFTCYT